MSEFPANPGRLDPYPNSNFLAFWDGANTPIPGVSRVSGLSRTTDVVNHREGNGPPSDHKAPGLTEFEPIILERGLTQDKTLSDWANKVWSEDKGYESGVSLPDFRREIRIELLNEEGQVVMRWIVLRCWPSGYALSDLDADGTGVVVERITLQNEGWQRDGNLTEPAETPH